MLGVEGLWDTSEGFAGVEALRWERVSAVEAGVEKQLEDCS